MDDEEKSSRSATTFAYLSFGDHISEYTKQLVRLKSLSVFVGVFGTIWAVIEALSYFLATNFSGADFLGAALSMATEN